MNAKQTLSERFDEEFCSYDKTEIINSNLLLQDGKEINTPIQIKNFITAELTSLAQEILSKKESIPNRKWEGMRMWSEDMISVSDILAILKERGIELDK